MNCSSRVNLSLHHLYKTAVSRINTLVFNACDSVTPINIILSITKIRIKSHDVLAMERWNCYLPNSAGH